MKTAAAVLALICCSSPCFAQDWAKESLAKSSRHHEWVQVKYGDRTVNTFLVYPEVKKKAPAVLVIHETLGLTDWVRSVADQLAAAGYIAIAPDLLSGMGPQGGRTSDFSDGDAAMQATWKLDATQVITDLNAVTDYAKKLPAANGKLAVAGFCWGGSQAFRFANSRNDLAAAFVFYGPGPADVGGIRAPVYAFYGGDDARVGATIPATTEAMKKAGKKYEPVTYDGAGHGFMRTGEDPNGTEPNKHARKAAWERWLKLLQRL